MHCSLPQWSQEILLWRCGNTSEPVNIHSMCYFTLLQRIAIWHYKHFQTESCSILCYQSDIQWMWFKTYSLICPTHFQDSIPLIPTDGAPAATAARAYSIWTSLPEGLQDETHDAKLTCYETEEHQLNHIKIQQHLQFENKTTIDKDESERKS